MFKLKFLSYRTNAALKKNRSLRASMPYKHAQHVGIIFSVDDRHKHDDIKGLIKHLEQDGKKVKVLEFLPEQKENYEFMFDFFTSKDLSFWGNIESNPATQFAETNFDYLFYIDKESNPLILNILARSKANCRVGKFAEGESSFFELMIEHNGTITGLIDNMYKYTKQLK